MQQPSKQDCLNWFAQVAQDLLPHIPASARGGFQQQAQAALQILTAEPAKVTESANGD